MGELQKICLYCRMVIIDDEFLIEGFPIHANCKTEWEKLNETSKRLKKRIYKLYEDDSWSPSYYHGLDDSEMEALDVVEEMRQEFPSEEDVKQRWLQKYPEAKEVWDSEFYMPDLAATRFELIEEWLEKWFGNEQQK